MPTDDPTIAPFTTPVDRETLADPRDRLGRTRRAAPELIDDRSQGVPRGVLRARCGPPA